MDYFALKHLHMSFAATSGMLFLLRGCWMLQESPMLNRRIVRVLPHIVDTGLLATAITLALWSGQTPWGQPWLGAKVLALFVYIGLGTVALKRGRTRAVRIAAFAGALATFAYIVGVALTKHLGIIS
ncbi:MAG: SirB2 family protein [Pseudomonadota bacterium]